MKRNPKKKFKKDKCEIRQKVLLTCLISHPSLCQPEVAGSRTQFESPEKNKEKEATVVWTLHIHNSVSQGVVAGHSRREDKAEEGRPRKM